MNCAFGLVSADIAQEYSVALSLPMPAPAERVNAVAHADVARCARASSKAKASTAGDMRLEWSFDLRYRRQVHQVTTPYARADAGRRPKALARLASRFRSNSTSAATGKGSAYRARRNRDHRIPPQGTRLDGSGRQLEAGAARRHRSRRRACAGGGTIYRRCAGRHGGRRRLRFRAAAARQ